MKFLVVVTPPSIYHVPYYTYLNRMTYLVSVIDMLFPKNKFPPQEGSLRNKDLKMLPKYNQVALSVQTIFTTTLSPISYRWCPPFEDTLISTP